MEKCHDQGTMTERSAPVDKSSLNLKEILNLAASLFLPLMLGIFTVVITFQQQRVAHEQRLEDRKIAEQQREQDMNISIMQRQEDRQSAQEQREQDLKNWALQREQDLNTSRQQRELDRQLADEKRHQDYELANATRMMSREQRDHELDIELQRHRDSLLVAYMNELGLLLDKNNGTVTSNPVIAALVRAKTLTLVRQLDPTRNSHLIRFLFEVGQLTNGAMPLDLSNAELNQIDLTSRTRHSKMHRLCLAGAFLMNASFDQQDLSEANFHQTILIGATFRDASLNFADLSESQLDDVDFSHSQMYRVNLVQSSLDQVKLNSVNATESNFSLTNMVNAQGIGIVADRTSFIHTDLKSSQLSSASFLQSNFLRATLDFCNLSETNLSEANLIQASLFSANLINATLIGAQIYMANLSQVNMRDAQIERYQLEKAVSIEKLIFSDGTLIYDRPLVMNGNAKCGAVTDEEFAWLQDRKEIIIQPYPNDPNNCYFAPSLKTTFRVRFYQRIDISEKYGELIEQQRAIALFSASFGPLTEVDITFAAYERYPLFYQKIMASSNQLVKIVIPQNTTSVEVVVEFLDSKDQTGKWCDNVQLIIQVDRRLEL